MNKGNIHWVDQRFGRREQSFEPILIGWNDMHPLSFVAPLRSSSSQSYGFKLGSFVRSRSDLDNPHKCNPLI